MRPRGKITSAVVVTVMSVVVSMVSVVMSMTMFVPAWAPTSPFGTMKVSHQDVFFILLG